jgi:preprotein translocase subunit SecA
MEDNLMRIFGDPNRTKALLSRAGMREGEAIESNMLSRQIERAQRKVEAHNFDIRKNLLEYDDVANDQRKVVYHQRNELMAADDIKDSVAAIREEVVAGVVEQYIPPGSIEDQWDPEGLAHALERDFGVHLDVPGWLKADTRVNDEGIRARCIEALQKSYDEKEQSIGSKLLRQVEKEVMLKQLDHHWKEHLAAMDYLRQGIHLRGYAQKNPKQEYKREAFEMFGVLLDQVKHDTISILSRIRIQSEQDLLRMEAQRRAIQEMQFKHAEASALAQQSAAQPSLLAQPSPPAERAAPPEPHAPFVRGERKVGRNEPCPCGSGKKFKQCHGRLS